MHYRLERLAASARAVRPSQAELIGMLIAEASLDKTRLEQAVIAYRRMTVGDVVDSLEQPAEGAPEEATEDTIVIALRGPGRPPGR